MQRGAEGDSGGLTWTGAVRPQKVRRKDPQLGFQRGAPKERRETDSDGLPGARLQVGSQAVPGAAVSEKGGKEGEGL